MTFDFKDLPPIVIKPGEPTLEKLRADAVASVKRSAKPAATEPKEERFEGFMEELGTLDDTFIDFMTELENL